MRWEVGPAGRRSLPLSHLRVPSRPWRLCGSNYLPSIPTLTERRYIMRIHFVTFATPAFRVRQWLLNRSALCFGKAVQLHVWTQAKLEQDGFTNRHSELFPNSVGFGWYAWKPYIILRALQKATEGDLVIYQDTGRREPLLISRSLHQWDAFLTERSFPCIAGVRIPEWGPNRLWTKRSVFAAMGLDDARYANEPQIQASWSVWKKCRQTEAFVREWAELCQHLDLVGGQLENGPAAEVADFKEHRWDQSLLTLLALRDGLPFLDPADCRTADLNEKAIDSFTQIQTPAFGMAPFRGLARLYYHAEIIIKKFGLIRKICGSI